MPGGGRKNLKWIIALTTMLGTFMEVLDTSVVNVALPHMKGTYAAGTEEITWIITSYLVANAIILPITGWLGSYFGRKRLYLFCLTTFTLASFACGLAPSLGTQILFRVIQGLSGGAMVPMSQAITMEAFPEEEQGMATAVFAIGVIFGPILGPLVGGWITDNWSWPWIYWINVPVGLVAFFLATAFLEDPPYLSKPEGRIDGWSLACIAVGLGCLELFLNRGERLDWFAANEVKLYAGLSALGLALFVWRSLTTEDPLVDLSLFRLPEFAGGMLLTFMTNFGLYAALIILPLFVQNMLGFTPTWAGIVLSPGGVASVVAMVAAGVLVGRVNGKVLLVAGVLSLAWSTWLLSHVSPQTSIAFLILARIFNGIGMGFTIVVLASGSMVRVPLPKKGQASGIYNLMRNEGGSVGIAVATTILANRAQFHHARLAEHITATSGTAQAGFSTLTAGLFRWAGTDPVSTRRLAQGLVGAEVVRQGYYLAFVDVFAFLALAFLVTLPFIFALKEPPKGAGGLGSAH
jgi:DHA2 family multidrug resistance protein